MTVVAIDTFSYSSLGEWIDYWRSKGAGDVTWAAVGDGSVVRQFKVKYLGTTIIIDRQGRVSYRDAGPTPYETLKVEIVKVF